MFAIPFPAIDPVIFHIAGPLAIRWYSLAYVLGILLGWYYAGKIIRTFSIGINKKHLDNFVNWSVVGIVFGGRLGYCLFYNPFKYLAAPIDIFKIYEGGMSFHGGLLGLIVATYCYCYTKNLPFFAFVDLLAITSPIGLFFGRIANFINAEAYGRITDVSFAVLFPVGNMEPRHASQIYEAFTEGIMMFLILNYLVFKRGILSSSSLASGLFLLLYSLFRLIIENFREPDYNLGFFWGSVTMGQILSVPMLLIGIYLIYRVKCHYQKR